MTTEITLKVEYVWSVLVIEPENRPLVCFLNETISQQ